MCTVGLRRAGGATLSCRRRGESCVRCSWREGPERFAHRHPPPPTLFLQPRLLLLETLLTVHVLADAEDHPTIGFDDPHELVERLGRGVVRCEDPHADGGREGAAL